MVVSFEALRVGLKIGSKLLLARFCGRHIFSEKLHLLPDAAANDDVVTVQAGGPALAVKHFVVNVVLDEALQFLFARRALPCAGKTVRKVGNSGRRNNDPSGRFSFPLVDKLKEAKQSRAEHEKLE
jgi:hypothetical protein